MHSDPMARVLAGAVALALLVPSVVYAQAPTPPPRQFGPTLQSGVITNALDDASMNQVIEDTARDYHEYLGGKASGKRNGWFPIAP